MTCKASLRIRVIGENSVSRSDQKQFIANGNYGNHIVVTEFVSGEEQLKFGAVEIVEMVVDKLCIQLVFYCKKVKRRRKRLECSHGIFRFVVNEVRGESLKKNQVSHLIDSPNLVVIKRVVFDERFKRMIMEQVFVVAHKITKLFERACINSFFGRRAIYKQGFYRQVVRQGFQLPVYGIEREQSVI